MTDLNPQADPTGTPEDVATLYSWANLHGAKYRDFSAARAQTREKARLRAEQAAEEQSQVQLEAAAAEAERAAEEMQAAETAHQAELAAQQAEFEAELAAQREAEQAAQFAAQHAAEQAARLEAEQAAQLAAQHAAEQTARLEVEQAARQAAQHVVEQSQRAAQRDAEQAAQLARQRAAQQAAARVAERLAQQRAWQPPPAERIAAPTQQPAAAPNSPQQPQASDYQNYSRPQAFRPASGQPQYPSAREASAREDSFPPRNLWDAPESREPAGRPAWLSTDQPEIPGARVTPSPLPQQPYSQPQAPPSYPQAPEDTLQGSRDRLTSRWFALRGVFDAAPAPAEAAPSPQIARAPSMAVFSLAGGVGKTSLVATLGRALSARGERVLLVDTADFGLLPFFFGATDQRPGLLRTFSPPGASSDAPIQMVTLDPEGLGNDQNGNPNGPESLAGEIAKFARAASRIIVDLATASGATTRRIMRMAPLVLVPVVPDMNSVVSVSSIDAFFEHNGNPNGKPSLPFYVLNQFDATLPLHLDVREVLREQLGERLLPFALRRTPAMSEALAEGMTVMDYAPGSTLAEDFATLAGWVKSLSAPATTSYRGVRWSER
jgi:cellulose synthase operon protein YhjQ